VPAPDAIHGAVKSALIKDGWTITDDPYTIEYEEVTLFADLGAERPIAAERGGERIVVEVKSFMGRSPMHDLELALGQYTLYLNLLELTAPDRTLYLAISDLVHADLFQQKAVEVIVQRLALRMIVVDTRSEEIVAWRR
jgi:hypothetical protein